MKTLKRSMTLAMLALTNPLSVYAGDGSITAKHWDLGTLVTTFIQWATILGGIAALAFLIYAGIKYISSSGDPGKVEEAQKQIVSAIIGLAIIILAYSIVSLVLGLFGESLTGTLPTIPTSTE